MEVVALRGAAHTRCSSTPCIRLSQGGRRTWFCREDRPEGVEMMASETSATHGALNLGLRCSDLHVEPTTPREADKLMQPEGELARYEGSVC